MDTLPKVKELDIDRVRQSFPGLDSDWAFMDNAGGSQALGSVPERIKEHLLHRNVQIGGTYERSLKAARSLEQGRRAVMEIVNASRPEEIVFSPTSTVALQNLSRAMASSFEPGDEVVVTNFDHESNIGPWLKLRERGAEIITWKIDPETLRPERNDLEGLLSERTKLVCVGHVSNILGHVNQIREFADAAHAAGALICVDSVAFAPHRAIDVKALDVDFLVFSAYKAYGPHIAAMYGRYDLLRELDNLYHYFYGKEKVPAKLEPGNANYELAYSLTAVRDYLVGLGSAEDEDVRRSIERGFELITRHEARLTGRLLDFLGSRKDIRVVGSTSASDPDRLPTVSFKVNGIDSSAIARGLENFRVAARFGDFHARRLLEHLDLSGSNGVVRISLVHYNTIDEVDRLVQALGEILP